jgi:hypothetical protein
MRKRLTFANVTSSLALFLALSGVSYAAIILPAGSVGPRQLKANAVTSSKLAARAVLSRNIAPGAVTGAAINLASLGKVPAAVTADSAATAVTAASAAVARVKTVTATASAVAGAGTSASATCDPGLTVVGGGASLSSEDNQIVNDSYPSAANRWTVDVFASSSGGAPFTVYAICVPALATS